jgi:hypothetical protein
MLSVVVGCLSVFAVDWFLKKIFKKLVDLFCDKKSLKNLCTLEINRR